MERLRESLDTEPGMHYLQSNILAVVPFVAVGMPAAEAAQSLIDKYMSGANEVVQMVANSSATLLAQMVFAYSTFMGNEVRTNRDKYNEDNGRISPRKVVRGTLNAAKAFLSFDIPFSLSKISGQSWFLYSGKDPWKASGIFDSIAIPLWYTVAIPYGLHNGVIETDRTEEIYGRVSLES
tara:strand:- start:12653 stop:13192 length:540 start_codon:yes stop_codon:yes gene_type:complete